MFRKTSYIFLFINITLFIISIICESKSAAGFFVGAVMTISSLRACKQDKFRCEPIKDFFFSIENELLYQKIAMVIAVLFFIFGIFYGLI